MGDATTGRCQDVGCVECETKARMMAAAIDSRGRWVTLSPLTPGERAFVIETIDRQKPRCRCGHTYSQHGREVDGYAPECFACDCECYQPKP